MAKKTQNDSSLQTTKQMLDELDALMEQMLSLPVNDLEDAEPLTENLPVLSAKLTLLETPPTKSAPVYEAPEPIAEPRPVEPVIAQVPMEHPTFNPPHFMPATVLETRMPTFEAPPMPQPTPLTNDVAPPPLLPKDEPLLAETSATQAALATQWGFLPLLWINQTFDGMATKLPVLGAGLLSQTGRMLLGVSGLALTAGALGWLLKDWLGWN